MSVHGGRWITAGTLADLRAFTDAYPLRLAHDAADTLAYLCTTLYDVRLAQERFPKFTFIRCESMRGWRCKKINSTL